MQSLPTTYQELLSRVTEGGSREIFDPATEELIGLAPTATEADLDRKVQAAREAQVAWAKLSHAERSDYLMKAADAIEATAEPLAELLSRERASR